MEPITLASLIVAFIALGYALSRNSLITDLNEALYEEKRDVKLLDYQITALNTRIKSLEAQLSAEQKRNQATPSNPTPKPAPRVKQPVATSSTTHTTYATSPTQAVQQSDDASFITGVLLGNMLNSSDAHSVPATSFESTSSYTPEPEPSYSPPAPSYSSSYSSGPSSDSGYSSSYSSSYSSDSSSSSDSGSSSSCD
jgi:uncharacterized coiled-coil protein SlyX